MKLMIIGVTLAGFAAFTPLSAQGRSGNQGVPPGQMPPAGMCRVWIDGVPPGRQPRPTDCATARANVPVNARVIYGSNRGRGSNRDDCTYSRTTNSVSDIIFGRSGNNTTNCVDNTSNRVNGGWYPVSRDGSGGTIYERQTRDSNGNLIVQRARRDVYGNMSIISTRNAGNNGTYNNGRNNDGTYNGRRNGDGDEDDQGNYQNGRRRGNDNQNGRGHGNKNKDKDKNKNKNHHDGD